MPYSLLRGLRDFLCFALSSTVALLFVAIPLSNYPYSNQAQAAVASGGGNGLSTAEAKSLQAKKNEAKKKCEEKCKKEQDKAGKKSGGGSGGSGSGGSGGSGSGGGSTGGGTSVGSEGSSSSGMDKCVKDCCTKAFKELVEKNSKWKFGSVDPNHPDYDKIVESILDALIGILNTDSSGLSQANITYDIKNVKHLHNGVNVGALTQQHVVGGNGYSITYYNPDSTTIGRLDIDELLHPKRFFAQPADTLAQFDPDLFVVLTTHHELSHVRLLIAGATDPNLLLEWTMLWGASQNMPTTLPNQRYYNPNTAQNELAYNYDLYWGFAVAMSYYKTGLSFSNSQIWNFISSF